MKPTQNPHQPFHARVASGESPDYGAQAFDYDRNPSWRIFRIMAEFVDGFNFITKFPKSVTIFGSARVDEKSEHYKSAHKLARLLAKSGYAIVTGGGPGIMEAANKGAVEGRGESIGLNIQMPFEQRINPYVKKSIAFNYFFTRKVMLAFSANAFVFFPGGYGTLDEAFEIITLRQTHKLNPKIPIVLVGKDYWRPLADWLVENVYRRHGGINEQELKLWEIAGTAEEAFAIIKKAASRL
jgi:hypothetical protein